MFSRLKPLFSKDKHTDSIGVRPTAGFILVSLLLAVLVLYLQQTPLFRDWEQRFQTNFHLFGSFYSIPEEAVSPIVVVLITDSSLPAGAPRSPINRRWLGSLVETVSRHKPRLIGLNILLDRPLTPSGDRYLSEALAESGRVIIRSDPLYPALADFSDAALDSGTLRFRNDSSGAVQEICNTAAACRSDRILHKRLIRHTGATSAAKSARDDRQDWLRIGFSARYRLSKGNQYVRFPIFQAQELERLPRGALKDKIVLIGTGFADLYPMYRTPLPGEEQFLHETELLGVSTDMVLSGQYPRNLPPVYTALVSFLLFLVSSLLFVKRGVFSGIRFTAFAIPVLFFTAAAALTFFQMAIPYILPVVMLVLFAAGSTLQQVIQERLHRLMAELKLKEAKIDFLTNELHTHHLFNELSRLNVMISQQPESARAYLVEFAELLRTSLKYGDQSRVPIAVQVEYLRTYLQQQAIIHGELFQFALDTEETWEAVHAPWHVFYPLVENAVKAVESLLKRQPDRSALIELSLRKEADCLVFRVKNPLPEAYRSQSTKKGLANLEERLKWAYSKGNYQLSTGQQDQAWISTLQLPLEPDRS